MALYEIVVRYTGREEIRLADQPPPTGVPFEMAGRVWVAEVEEGGPGATVRYRCIELRVESRRMREERAARSAAAA